MLLQLGNNVWMVTKISLKLRCGDWSAMSPEFGINPAGLSTGLNASHDNGFVGREILVEFPAFKAKLEHPFTGLCVSQTRVQP
jgi:hypothetical protein